MVRYFFKISYLGTKYRGSQRVLEFPNETVQGIIEDGLRFINPVDVPLTSFASRTDKGVHALMNTFHVDLEHRKQGEVFQPHLLRKALNHYLKKNNQEIIITNVTLVPETFHARFHVKWRSYVYRLAILKPELMVTYPQTNTCEEYLPVSLLNRCHIVPSNLNISIVKDVINMYSGYHDFSAFTKNTLKEPWKNRKRVIDEIKFYEVPFHDFIDDPQYSNIVMWEFYVKSASFLYNQVRKLIGTALYAGFARMSLSEIESALNDPTLDKASKIRITPACGLYLSNLHYDKEGFIGKDLVDICKEESIVT